MNGSETYEEALARFKAQGGRIFGVVFKRRTGKPGAPAGSLRRIAARMGVVKGVKGAQGRPAAPRWLEDRQCNCITVFEMAGVNSGYKRIPLDGIVEFHPARVPQPKEVPVVER